MANYQWAAQLAVFEALEAALSDISVPVFDHVPPDQSYPYVSLDKQIVRRADCYDAQAADHLIWLTVWSDYRGMKEVTDILSVIEETFHRKKLTLSEGTAVAPKVSNVSASPDVDGLTYMGRAVIEFYIDYQKA